MEESAVHQSCWTSSVSARMVSLAKTAVQVGKVLKFYLRITYIVHHTGRKMSLWLVYIYFQNHNRDEESYAATPIPKSLIIVI